MPYKKEKEVFRTSVYKVMLVRESTFPIAQKKVQDPETAAKIFTEYLKSADKEIFVAMYLNSDNKILGIHTVSIGTLNSSLVHPREVFKIACMISAASIIISHNHPSGNSEPSAEDITITKQLVEVGEIMGIPVQDHIIITDDNGYTSFASRNLM